MDDERKFKGLAMAFVTLCGSCTVGVEPTPNGGTDSMTSDAGVDGGAASHGGTDGGVISSESCADYILCALAVAPATAGAIIDGYGVEGSCWREFGPGAAQCEAACAKGLAQVFKAFPKEAACGYEPSRCRDIQFEWKLSVSFGDNGCVDPVAANQLLSDPATEITCGTDPAFVWVVHPSINPRPPELPQALNFACTLDGHAVTCQLGDPGFGASLSGTASEDWRAIAGTVAYVNSTCGAEGGFTATR